MGGTFCFSVASGVAARLLLQGISGGNLRVVAALTLLGIAWLDSVSSVPSFFRGPIDRQTFDDFVAAQRFLSEQARPGRVAPYSGRYFYLLTPILSGRPIIAEAFNSHLMLRGVAELQRASLQSKQTFITFLNIAGVSQILIDKKDPDTPQSLQEFLRSVGTPIFENEHFVILENPESLYPAAFSKYFIELDEAPEEIATRSLSAAAGGLLVVSERTRFGDSEGRMRSETLRPATPMSKLSPEAVQRRTVERLRSTRRRKLAGWSSQKLTTMTGALSERDRTLKLPGRTAPCWRFAWTGGQGRLLCRLSLPGGTSPACGPLWPDGSESSVL